MLRGIWCWVLGIGLPNQTKPPQNLIAKTQNLPFDKYNIASRKRKVFLIVPFLNLLYGHFVHV